MHFEASIVQARFSAVLFVGLGSVQFDSSQARFSAV